MIVQVTNSLQTIEQQKYIILRCMVFQKITFYFFKNTN